MLHQLLHCVFVQYMIRVDMKRSLLNKDLQKQCEFIVEYKVKPTYITLFIFSSSKQQYFFNNESLTAL